MNRTAVITGASRGIGHAIAKALISKGYYTALCCRQEAHLSLMEDLKLLADEKNQVCLIRQVDVSDYDCCASFIGEIADKTGRIDLLINNAGISHVGLFQDMTRQEWDRIIHTNLSSVFNCCHLSVPYMLREKRGKIINISSVWGTTGASCEVAYSASKGGVNTFTRALARELAPSNIQVNAIACGAIDTQMNQFLSEEDRKVLEEEIPCGRMGQPEEVARLVCQLAESPDYLTGQIITLDGGWT